MGEFAHRVALVMRLLSAAAARARAVTAGGIARPRIAGSRRRAGLFRLVRRQLFRADGAVAVRVGGLGRAAGRGGRIGRIGRIGRTRGVGAAAVIVRWHAEALRTGGQTGDNLFALEYRRDSSWTAQRFAEQQIILDGVGDSSCHFSGQAILNIGSDLAGEVRYMEQGGGTYQYTVEVVGYLKKP